MSLPNVNELKERIGESGWMKMDDTLYVSVKITDARIRFGHVDYLVVPVAGKGRIWIESGRFIPDDQQDSPGDEKS